MCTLHPDALGQAARLDQEASEGRRRGPLHGQAGPGEGQHRHRRPAHHGRVAGPRRRPAAGPRRRAGPAAARRRHGRARQDEPQRVGQPARRGLDLGVERVRRPDPQPVRPEPVRGRVQLGQRRRGRRRPGAVRGRHRDRRLDLLPGRVQRLRRAQADRRAGAHRPAWCRSRRRRTPPARWRATVRDAAALLSVLAGNGTDYAAARGRRPAGRQADRRARGRRTGATAPHADAAAERAVGAAGRRGRHDRRRHRPARLRRLRCGRTSSLVMLAEFRVRAGAVPRHPHRRRAAHAGGRRRRSTASTPTSSWRTSGSRCSSRRWPGRGPRTRTTRGAGPVRGARRATTGSTRCCASTELDALVTPSYAPASPIDLVNPESHPGSCTAPTAMAGYPLLTVPTELAAGLPVAVSFWGTARAARRPWSRSRTATSRPATGRPAPCRSRRTRLRLTRPGQRPAAVRQGPRRVRARFRGPVRSHCHRSASVFDRDRGAFVDRAHGASCRAAARRPVR